MIKLIRNKKSNEMEKGCLKVDTCQYQDDSSCPVYDTCMYDRNGACPKSDTCDTDTAGCTLTDSCYVDSTYNYQ